jgi:hypothetical protein
LALRCEDVRRSVNCRLENGHGLKKTGFAPLHQITGQFTSHAGRLGHSLRWVIALITIMPTGPWLLGASIAVAIAAAG